MPTLPANVTENGRNLEEVEVVVLPKENESHQPIIGAGDTTLAWSPGGRYLAIEHAARNQFQVISVADIGSPEDGTSQLGRIVQATTDRFNSFSPVWGANSKDFIVDAYGSMLDTTKSDEDGATALIFLSDRDINLTGKKSPWGTRAPSPNFDGYACVHLLPLQSIEDAIAQNAANQYVKGAYGGGGASEVAMEGLIELNFLLLEIAKQEIDLTTDAEDGASFTNVTLSSLDDGNSTTTDERNSTGTDDEAKKNPFIIDTPISFGELNDESFSFARSSYRIDHIPPGRYMRIVCQLADDPSLVMLHETGLILLAVSDYPSDATEVQEAPEGHDLQAVELSSDGEYILTVQNGKLKVTPRKVKSVLAFFTDAELQSNIADTSGLHLSVFPNLEHQQLFADAWRMLRDYFYDADMHRVDWDEVFDRYLPLVERCAKREELDDVLRQMIGELSALHSFVYGGEYSFVHHGDDELDSINEIGSLGAILQRSVEKRGYVIKEISQRDPDLHMIDGIPIYSPLSDTSLKLSGQEGMQVGDVIVAVNGESALDVPDIHMLLRNTAGQSVRLDVLRIKSTSKFRELHKMKRRSLQTHAIETEEVGIEPEPLIVVPITPDEGEDLAYTSWEWTSRQRAKTLAAEADFTIGYAHIRSMSGAPAMNSFVRGFYPDFDKDALIIDVRNNRGGNIDSVSVPFLQD